MNIKMLKWMNAATVSVAQILKFPVLAREHRQLTCKIIDGENTLCTFFLPNYQFSKVFTTKNVKVHNGISRISLHDPLDLKSQTEIKIYLFPLTLLKELKSPILN